MSWPCRHAHNNRCANPRGSTRRCAMPGWIFAPVDQRRSAYPQRARAQHDWLKLPLPTTTIGSFPQTADVAARAPPGARQTGRHRLRRRHARRNHPAVRQRSLGPGCAGARRKAERNDMVEYFGEQLDGFIFARHGWVQSYGSPLRQAAGLVWRCRPAADDGGLVGVCPVNRPNGR